MKIESTAYTQADPDGFLDQLLDHERMAMADRLEQASAVFFARYPLINHLEQHVDQLERELGAVSV